jgi:hypothetical protein
MDREVVAERLVRQTNPGGGRVRWYALVDQPAGEPISAGDRLTIVIPPLDGIPGSGKARKAGVTIRADDKGQAWVRLEP